MRSFSVSPHSAALVLAALLAVAAPTRADPTPVLDQRSALQTSREVLGRSVGDHTLLDRESRPVRLSRYRGKPLVVSFLYTGCFQVCPTTTRTLHKAVTIAQEALGADKFNVVSIGFNQPADSPQALKSYAAQHGLDRPNWELLSPPLPAVHDITRDFGFSYVATPAGFDHILQVTVVDAQGRIYRHVYGESFSADMLVEPLKQVLTGAPLPPQGQFAALLEEVRILCTVYDPATGRYRVNYSIYLQIAGGLITTVAILWYVIAERRRARRLGHN